MITKAWSYCCETAWPGVRRRLKRSVWECQKYIVYRKSSDEVRCESSSGNVHFRLATIDDLPWIVEQMAHLGDTAEKVLREQFDGRDMTVIAKSTTARPELVCMMGISHEDYGLRLLGDEVGPDDVSFRRLWVRPTWRRRGLAERCMQFSGEAARNEGAPQLWSFVLENNTASCLLHRKLHYDDFGRIRLINRLGSRIAKTQTVAKERWTVAELPDRIVKL
jgi:ribosomal protein S18 acetylase RimI-like enzyme